MTATLIQMGGLISCGIIWRILQPAGLSAEKTRLVLTSAVYYMFLPAMILLVLEQTDIGLHSLKYTALGVSCIAFGFICMWLLGCLFKIKSSHFGAMILAAAFPNVTYLGLPVLEQTYGTWARSVAIQLDVFATAPLVFTLGIMTAVYYGSHDSPKNKHLLLHLNTPPFWAALIAVLLKLNGISIPVQLSAIFERLADAVVPLMLVSLGLALNVRVMRLRNIPHILPIIIVKLMLMPLFALAVLSQLNFAAPYHSAALLEMAMPSMIVGLVYCDRYGLDTPLYAMAVTITTLLSLFSLPFWYQLSI